MTPEDLRSEVAELLGVDAATLRDEVPLTDQGLDSIRLMTLVEVLRARDAEVSFADLAARPTLREWAEWLSASR